MANIRPKIIEVVDVDMVTRVFCNVTSCRVLSTGSLVVKYLEEGIENTKVYKKASWRSYSRVWENTYLGGYLASHPLKNNFMNEPVCEDTKNDIKATIIKSLETAPNDGIAMAYNHIVKCENCSFWHDCLNCYNCYSYILDKLNSKEEEK